MNNHPDRTDLLKAVKSTSKDISGHLKKCQDCSELFEVLKKFHFAGKLELVNAPEHLIQKAFALFDSGESILADVASKMIEMVFDSWENLAISSVRNSAVLDDRRLQFKSGDILFDLRAEKDKSLWNFTAQITKDSKPEDVAVVIGKQEYRSNEFGLIQWSSKKPPLQIKLKDKDSTIDLPKLNWKIN